MSAPSRQRSSLSSSSRFSLGASVRLHDLLEDNADEYGLIALEVERGIDARYYDDELAASTSSASSGDKEDMPATACRLPEEHVIPAGGEERLLASTPSTPSASVASGGGNGSDTESQHNDKSSIGSGESISAKPEQSKIGALLDKAKSRGRKLVGSKKKGPEVVDECSQCLIVVPSEDVPLGFDSEASRPTSLSASLVDADAETTQTKVQPKWDQTRDEDGLLRKRKPEYVDPADPSDPFHVQSLIHKCRVLPLFRSRMVILGSLIALTISCPGFVTGILWGFYVAIIGFLYFFVSDPISHSKKEDFLEDTDVMGNESEAKEALTSMLELSDGQGFGLGDGIIYRGWMNELRARYSPASYHVNSSQSVLVRLEGSMLRICRPAKAVLKHAFYDDPTLKQAQPMMVSQTIYDLKDAQISLRPKRLARRRWWSRKYPIFIRFAHAQSEIADVALHKKSQGMTRSMSLHQSNSVGGMEADLPTSLSEVRPPEDDDPGYSAESDESDDDRTSQGGRLARANSANDVCEFAPSSKGQKRRGRGIYLFVRAAREKERWFHLLREACAKARASSTLKRCVSDFLGSPAAAECLADAMVDENDERMSVAMEALDVDDDNAVEASKKADRVETTRYESPQFEYLKYRSNYTGFVRELLSIISVSPPVKPESGSTVSVDLGTMKWRPGVNQVSQELVDSINVLGTRIFFDFCRDEFWIEQVKRKIQCKLATIHLPYFIEKLELAELKIGTKTPRITSVYAPKVDEWGTWVDFEMKYKGGIRLVLQTSVNLIKLQSGAQQVETEKRVTKWTDSIRVAHYSDSDLPESPESSPDEDFGAKNHSDRTVKERTGKKILSIVERAAQSSLFQKAVKLPTVARFIEDVSTTPLMLNVEVEEVEGTMTVNIPPPPSDRLWYAFRKSPLLRLRAVPQVGDRSVDLSTVSDWIESKLRMLIEKNLVCPNMDDIILPVLSGNALLRMGYNK